MRFWEHDEHTLLCPCGDMYIHQRAVEVFNRSEDAEEGTHVLVDEENITVDRDLTGNPSLRRQGLSIYFWCEGCGDTSKLTIAQHKGVTLVEFAIVPQEVIDHEYRT